MAAFSRRKSDSLWKEMEKKIEGRSWQSLRGRFLRHIMGNMAKFKVTEAQLVEADERVMEETGKTPDKMKHYTQAEDEVILKYITEQDKYSWNNPLA